MAIEEKIGRLGFGLMRLPMLNGKVDMEQTVQMVDLFIENGFTYFDTAYGYIDGESEIAAGKAIVSRYPRDSFQLATKLPAHAAANAKEAEDMFWTSLKRTGVDYFDFYLLHNLGGERTKLHEGYGMWEFLARQKQEGRIRHLGFSMHASAQQLDEMLTKHPEAEFVQLQVNYSDWDSGIVQSRKCYEVAQKHQKPVVIMEPVKGGALSSLQGEAAGLLKKAAPNASQASWAIRFAASLSGVLTVLSGMSTIEQMKDNLSFMSGFKPLSDEERRVLQEVRAVMAKVPQVPCTDCKYCVSGCPQNIAIPGIFKVYNDYLIYRDAKNWDGSYKWETELSHKAGASDCIACGLCEGVCPQSIKVIQELKKAAAALETPAD